MRNCFVRITFAIIISLGAAVAAFGDIKIKTKTSFAGQAAEGTTYIKGARQRTSQSYGGAISFDTLYQCDLKRMIQLNDRAKKYMISQLGGEDSSTSAAKPQPGEGQPGATRRGGVVTYTTTITDTGERKNFFGYTARHLKSIMTADSSPDACSPVKMRIETDGWYIDFDADVNCANDGQAAPQFGVGRPACRDEVRFKRVGTAKLGYPVLVTTTVYDENGRVTTTSTSEVVEISKATLDASLFDLPAGYTEAKDYQELMGIPSVGSMTDPSSMPSVRGADSATDTTGAMSAAQAKRPGAVRVGVVAVNNKTDRSPSTDSVRAALISSISSGNIEAVPIDSTSASAIEAEAKQKGCDYVLYTDIAQLKKSGSKVGGLLGRASGVGVGGEKYEARLDFKLFAVGSSSSQLTSSSTAKEEGAEDVSLMAAADKEAKTVIAEIQKNR
ncbi:MAG TPA: hypothetical protein VKA70_17085 [Blastocatellia bacterium]|nr:hypothetical protein [Blastocatellia bacterium]